MSARKDFADTRDTLPALRFEVIEAAQILRMSRAQLYNRIHDGSISRQKDGARTYITRAELERYVESCAAVKSAAPRSEGAGRNRAPAEPAQYDRRWHLSNLLGCAARSLWLDDSAAASPPSSGCSGTRRHAPF